MKLQTDKALRMFFRGVRNYWIDKPICLSFEVLHSCNLNCHHCNWGGNVNETLLSPGEIKDIYLKFKPPVVQISGGEPLLRDDIVDIFRELRQKNGLPYLILVTNASLMTEEKYRSLKEAGVDQFSVSIDFADERHDYFRRQPGLFNHLENLIPRLSSIGYDDIILNTAITHENYKYLKPIADLAERWGVYVNYSAYTILRTANRDLCIQKGDELELLRSIIYELLRLKSEKQRIVTSEITLQKTYEFFRDGKFSGCNAGKRFFVVPPNGLFLPCAMHRSHLYPTQEEMIKKFSNQNKCGSCYVSIRSMTDLSFVDLLKSSISSFLTLKKSAAAAKKYVPSEEQFAEELIN